MEIARHWRLKDQRYSLIGEVCHHCENKIFPPRDVCPHCGDKAEDTFQFSGKGEVFSSTIIYEAPSGYEHNVPYQIALVKLDEGPMVTAQLTDLDDSTKLTPIGTKVEMVTRRMRDDGDERGLIIYSYKFRPELISSSPKEASMSSK